MGCVSMSNELEAVNGPLPETENAAGASSQNGAPARPMAVVPPAAHEAVAVPVPALAVPALGVPTLGASVHIPCGALATPAQPFNILKFVHTALRGRYALAVVLGLIVGAAGALGAWRLGKPQYQSEGLIRIKFNSARDDRTPFQIVMESQRGLITSRRVTELAVQGPVWRGQQLPEDWDDYFRRNLSVVIGRGSEFMRVIVTDTDRQRAMVAVNSVLDAYREIYKQQEREQEQERIGYMETRRRQLEKKVEDFEQELRAQPYSGNLRWFYDATAEQVTRLRDRLLDLEMAMVMGAGTPPAPVLARSVTTTQPAIEDTGPTSVATTQGAAPATQPGGADPGILTIEQIALFDGRMQQLLDVRDQAEADLRSLKKRYGDAHPMAEAAVEAVQRAERRVESYAKAHRARARAGGPGGTTGESLENLKASEARIKQLLTQRLGELGKTDQGMHVQSELRKVEEALSKLVVDIENAKNEDLLAGRISVLATGQVPLSPSKDSRVKLAAAGGVVGLCLPASLIVLLSLTSRRLRYSEDAHEGPAAGKNIPLLGILPELPEKHRECEEMLAAAHSVHQIRVTLEAQESNHGSRAYLMTSSTAGEGKTSLTMSLGLSFASAGLRTLVIDGDLVGRRLTSSFSAKDMEGLQEAIAVGSLKQFIRKTRGGLHLLMAGHASTTNSSALPAAAIRSLLKEARRYFHVVLIDSGPILGSLEAAVLAQEVDGVIFTISQGQERRLVEHALRRLETLKVRMAGLIFNRAKRQDFSQSPFGSSARSSYATTDRASSPKEELQQLTNFGPLVHAVAGGAGEGR
jgi:succinoglycan biosynthesis transport protein ExoP